MNSLRKNTLISHFFDFEKTRKLIYHIAKIQKHEFQADYDRRNVQKLKEVIQSQKGEIYRAHEGDEIINFFINNYWSDN